MVKAYTNRDSAPLWVKCLSLQRDIAPLWAWSCNSDASCDRPLLTFPLLRHRYCGLYTHSEKKLHFGLLISTETNDSRSELHFCYFTYTVVPASLNPDGLYSCHIFMLYSIHKYHSVFITYYCCFYRRIPSDISSTT